MAALTEKGQQGCPAFQFEGLDPVSNQDLKTHGLCDTLGVLKSLPLQDSTPQLLKVTSRPAQPGPRIPTLASLLGERPGEGDCQGSSKNILLFHHLLFSI